MKNGHDLLSITLQAIWKIVFICHVDILAQAKSFMDFSFAVSEIIETNFKL